MPTTRLHIDFVSDVSCPWCAVGLGALEAALRNVAPEVTAELRFQPFELNPQMPPEGQDTFEHLNQKYGSSREQQAQARAAIRARGADVGFAFSEGGRPRIYNTFDAHRLLHWAELEDLAKQAALKKALLKACHTDGENPSDPEVLVRLATESGLDPERARSILASDEYAAETRERERLYTDAGIHSVPAIIIDNKHLISGGQPVEVFERALRQIAGAEPARTAEA
ncbi:DsbA family oxidoreductase [Variovorax ginsengisoli]|jgi:predicted DsbA family dithiol-disulfide isomerase|uniref:DsbA family oxidoreductase n=1 Tax=Variovorax ginsengisoli TaxID=363844 RepID=A0ABT8SF91_9BURK|nr:DsbA family oxidoreductase [Variovorax ginsengisoli]MDN8617652.1 DsbA family oxidoreductase [Variovorax ginsengisoli]MDO1536822.1 DsbA family oxidoreductase [Variovorax ginsengisoli]